MIYAYTTIGILNFVSRGLIIFPLFLLINIEIHSIEILTKYMDVYLRSIVYNMILQQVTISGEVRRGKTTNVI